MSETITNMEKYENYRVQMGRLNRAMKEHFFLEAIFIEYAVMEDRFNSILLTSGHWTSQPDEHVSIDKKISLVEKLYENKSNELIHKYFSLELLAEVRAWKGQRNTYMHNLMNGKITTADLEAFAAKGQELAKQLNTSSTSYRRALQKLADTQQ